MLFDAAWAIEIPPCRSSSLKTPAFPPPGFSFRACRLRRRGDPQPTFREDRVSVPARRRARPPEGRSVRRSVHDAARDRAATSRAECSRAPTIRGTIARAAATAAGRRAVDIAAWLHGLGLQQYEPAFRANEIDDRVLPSLTVEDLKDLGVSLVGHRRRLMDAIATLGSKPADDRRFTSARRCRTPAAHVNVLRPCRLDRALIAARSRGSARGHRRVSPRRRRNRRRAGWVT
jgi:hypothetical protein